MIIDVHTFPGFFWEICADPDQVRYRREAYFLYKQHVWPLSLFITQMDAAGIDRSIIAAEDVSSRSGRVIVSNEEVRQLVDFYPERLIGFAAVDPYRPDAEEVLERAFAELGLAGLKLSPAMQHILPTAPELRALYEICLKYDKPVLFEAGMTWIKDSPSSYAQPANFEALAIDYPALRFCLGHFGWPWIMETAMLLLKYPNVYADTALLYFDSPSQFFQKTFNEQLGEYWIDRMLYDKVMFGSTYPRIEQKRMVKAMAVLNLRPEQRARVMGQNALTFLSPGGEQNG